MEVTTRSVLISLGSNQQLQVALHVQFTTRNVRSPILAVCPPKTSAPRQPPVAKKKKKKNTYSKLTATATAISTTTSSSYLLKKKTFNHLQYSTFNISYD